jgi:hypothetical protein
VEVDVMRRYCAHAAVAGFIFALLSATVAPSKEREHIWEHGVVVSQNLSSSPAGTYAAPVGTATVAVPIYRRSNVVVVDTDVYRYQWSEVGRKPVILPVNGSIEFYREGNWFIVLDSKHKRHKFALVGMTARR